MLCNSIRTRGFAVVDIPMDICAELEYALAQWKLMGEFRFPPPSGLEFGAWDGVYQRAYKNMKLIAAKNMKVITTELKERGHMGEEHHYKKLDDCNFDASFMNIFNYAHGKLCPHRDRCLVTIVYRQNDSSFIEDKLMKSMWCEEPVTKNWVNIDNEIRGKNGKACLLVGDELSYLTQSYLPAALHCVLHSPYRNIEQQENDLLGIKHHNRHNDRMSIALILSSASITKFIDNSIDI
jgi:hypothetical protein